jgi:hypothetical protein
VKSWIRIALLILISFTTGATCVAQEVVGKRPDAAPEALAKGIACLTSQDWVKADLKDLGLQNGKIIGVRFDVGTIPGTSPETPNKTNVLFLSPNGRRGWLLFFRQQQDGTVTAIRNGYRVRRSDGGWSASEGNGGIATYKAISSYVTTLSKKPKVWLTLQLASSGCPSD